MSPPRKVCKRNGRNVSILWTDYSRASLEQASEGKQISFKAPLVEEEKLPPGVF